MSKDHFRFKQFSIFQRGATLKICTDSCLFGAWVAAENQKARNCLDIGSGTGLLGLMFAQKHPETKIDSIEIDKESAELTSLNFNQSKYFANLNSINTSLQNYTHGFKEKYETIICNPPFFENQLNSEKQANNLAKHSSALSKDELLTGIDKLLSDVGSAYILLPVFESEAFIQQASTFNLFLKQIVKVKNFQNSNYIRFMMKFNRGKSDVAEETIAIYEQEKVYSAAFTDYLKDYYLYL